MPTYRVNGMLMHIRMTNTKKRPAPAPCCARIEIAGRPQRCRAMSTILCDFPLEGGGTCDAPLCPDHATEVGHDRHYCQIHTKREPPMTTPHLPQFITFTGADEHTSIAGMLVLANEYPIEWGVLFSPKRQGAGRYPPLEFVEELTLRPKLKLSAHLCGGYSEAAVYKRVTPLDPIVLQYFDRVQVNMHNPEFEIVALREWSATLRAQMILQCRGEEFPDVGGAVWLFDASGGRGIEPKAWPKPTPYQLRSGTLRGYAGGLNPENVRDHVATIGVIDQGYWIDMETGVRDENDRFSLDRCRAVCEAVFGSPT